MSDIATPPTITISAPIEGFDTVTINAGGKIDVKAASTVTIQKLVKK
jgi:hypothetical protein